MPDEDILDNPFDDIDETGISDEDIIGAGSEEFGPYESHLYTEGNEFCLEDATDLEHAINDGH